MVDSPPPPGPPGEPVALADLETVTRYSLALRTASAPRDELVDVLRRDLAWLTGGAPEPARVARAPRRPAARRAAP